MAGARMCVRSEEHTSELQSHVNLVCRLLREKKNTPCTAPPRPRVRSLRDDSHSGDQRHARHRHVDQEDRIPDPPVLVFFFHHTATTEIYTLSLHDALPIWGTVTAPRQSSLPSGWRSVNRPPYSRALS